MENETVEKRMRRLYSGVDDPTWAFLHDCNRGLVLVHLGEIYPPGKWDGEYYPSPSREGHSFVIMSLAEHSPIRQETWQLIKEAAVDGLQDVEYDDTCSTWFVHTESAWSKYSSRILSQFCALYRLIAAIGGAVEYLFRDYTDVCVSSKIEYISPRVGILPTRGNVALVVTKEERKLLKEWRRQQA